MNEFLDRACDLLAIPSTADNLRQREKALEFVAVQLEQTPGISVRRFDAPYTGASMSIRNNPSIVAYAGDELPTEFDVLLHGHLDVLPGETSQFRPTISGDRLYARGAVDMKVAALVLADEFRENAVKAKGRLGLMLTTDEEVGGDDGSRHLTEDEGITSKFTLVGETTGPTQIGNELKGFARAVVYFSGISTHDGYPWKGQNAELKKARYIVAMDKLYPEPTSEVWRTTVSAVLSHCDNETWNLTPDYTAVGFGLRFVPGDLNFEDRTTLESYLNSIAPETEPFAQVEMLEPAQHVDIGHPALQQLAAAIHSVHGRPATYIGRHGSGDGRFFPAAVEYGLDGDGSHSDSEWLDIRSIEPYRRTIRRFLGNTVLSDA